MTSLVTYVTRTSGPAPVCPRCSDRHDPVLACWRGRYVAELRYLVLAQYGDVCHLCHRPGSTSPDHLQPRSEWGDDTLANLRPSHRVCNQRRGNSPAPGWARQLVLVLGPDALATTSMLAGPGDMVLDVPTVTLALAGRGHTSAAGVPEYVANVAGAAVQAALRRALPAPQEVTVYLTGPTEAQASYYAAAGAQVLGGAAPGPAVPSMSPRFRADTYVTTRESVG